MSYLEVAFGNITETQAERLAGAAGSIDDVGHIPGSAEPWISRLVWSFIVATGARTVLETGSFMGGTSVWMYDALRKLGGGSLHLAEIDDERLSATAARLYDLSDKHPDVTVTVHLGDVLGFLSRTDLRFDLAWVDDTHTKQHVERELTLLLPRMNAGGVVLGHDVWGSCDLQDVFRKFGGFSLNLPRLGAAGGLGIIQISHPESLGVWIPGESQVL